MKKPQVIDREGKGLLYFVTQKAHYSYMGSTKDSLIQARVTGMDKKAIQVLAEKRGESAGVILREAVKEYLSKHSVANFEDDLPEANFPVSYKSKKKK